MVFPVCGLKMSAAEAIFRVIYELNLSTVDRILAIIGDVLTDSKYKRPSLTDTTAPPFCISATCALYCLSSYNG